MEIRLSTLAEELQKTKDELKKQQEHSTKKETEVTTLAQQIKTLTHTKGVLNKKSGKVQSQPKKQQQQKKAKKPKASYSTETVNAKEAIKLLNSIVTDQKSLLYKLLNTQGYKITSLAGMDIINFLSSPSIDLNTQPEKSDKTTLADELQEEASTPSHSRSNSLNSQPEQKTKQENPLQTQEPIVSSGAPDSQPRVESSAEENKTQQQSKEIKALEQKIKVLKQAIQLLIMPRTKVPSLNLKKAIPRSKSFSHSPRQKKNEISQKEEQVREFLDNFSKYLSSPAKDTKEKNSRNLTKFLNQQEVKPSKQKNRYPRTTSNPPKHQPNKKQHDELIDLPFVITEFSIKGNPNKNKRAKTLTLKKGQFVDKFSEEKDEKNTEDKVPPLSFSCEINNEETLETSLNSALNVITKHYKNKNAEQLLIKSVTLQDAHEQAIQKLLQEQAEKARKNSSSTLFTPTTKERIINNDNSIVDFQSRHARTESSFSDSQLDSLNLNVLEEVFEKNNSLLKENKALTEKLQESEKTQNELKQTHEEENKQKDDKIEELKNANSEKEKLEKQLKEEQAKNIKAETEKQTALEAQQKAQEEVKTTKEIGEKTNAENKELQEQLAKNKEETEQAKKQLEEQNEKLTAELEKAKQEAEAAKEKTEKQFEEELKQQLAEKEQEHKQEAQDESKKAIEQLQNENKELRTKNTSMATKLNYVNWFNSWLSGFKTELEEKLKNSGIENFVDSILAPLNSWVIPGNDLLSPRNTEENKNEEKNPENKEEKFKEKAEAINNNKTLEQLIERRFTKLNERLNNTDNNLEQIKQQITNNIHAAQQRAEENKKTLEENTKLQQEVDTLKKEIKEEQNKVEKANKEKEEATQAHLRQNLPSPIQRARKKSNSANNKRGHSSLREQIEKLLKVVIEEATQLISLYDRCIKIIENSTQELRNFREELQNQRVNTTTEYLHRQDRQI